MKSFRLYSVITVVLLVIYIVAEFNQPKPVSWDSTLYFKDKIPYGTYIFYHQLNDFFPDANVKRTNNSVAKLFTDTGTIHGNYLIIAHSVNLDKTEYKALERFVHAGNSVFISAFRFGGYLGRSLKLSTYSEYKASQMVFNFTNGSIKQGTGYQFRYAEANQYFYNFDTARAVSLCKNQLGHTNYLKFKLGSGNLYLLTNPHMLTNYALLKPQGAAFAENALSYLPPVKTVYWDEYQNNDIPEDLSPMRVIFSHENLRWPYYISLASLLLFVLYEVKRRQRVIPVIEPLKNATLDFVTTVGNVYYEQRDNSDIAVKKITYFSDFLRTRYQLKLDFKDKDFPDKLARKAGIDKSFAKDLTEHIAYMVAQSRVSDHDLITLNNLIDKFYAQT